MNKDLTNEQIERQDYVDNQIFDLIQNLNPTDKEINWDIELISEIRDSIAIWFAENGICEEQSFYPYLEEE